MNSQSPAPATATDASAAGNRHPQTGPRRLHAVLARKREKNENWSAMGEAWTALSTLIAGIGIWGGVGAVVDHFAHTWPIFFVVGVIVGNFGGSYLIYIRHFRDAPTSTRFEFPEDRRAA